LRSAAAEAVEDGRESCHRSQLDDAEVHRLWKKNERNNEK
jgi:hypothetical protein